MTKAFGLVRYGLAVAAAVVLLLSCASVPEPGASSDSAGHPGAATGDNTAADAEAALDTATGSGHEDPGAVPRAGLEPDDIPILTSPQADNQPEASLRRSSTAVPQVRHHDDHATTTESLSGPLPVPEIKSTPTAVSAEIPLEDRILPLPEIPDLPASAHAAEPSDEADAEAAAAETAPQPDPDAPEPPAAAEETMQPAEPDAAEEPASAAEAAAAEDATPAAAPAAPASAAPAAPEPPAVTPPGPASSDLHDAPPALENAAVDHTVQAGPEESFRVVLPGGSWIYLGERDGKRQVSFVSRSHRDGDTEFVFRSSEAGEYLLGFQRQDLSRGVTERMLARAEVTEDAADADDSESRGTGHSTTGPSADADGDVDAPGSTLPGLDTAVAPDISPQAGISSDPAAETAMGDRAPDSGGRDSGTPDSADLPRLLDAGNAEGISHVLQRVAPDELADEHDTAVLLQALAEVMSLDRPNGAGGLLQQLLQDEAARESRPQLLYWLGQYYEHPDTRDYRRAVEHYSELEQRYPFHELAEPAGVRRRFLRRHFMDIR
ncbi:tetratricopeptide repeat protein [Spirochaeta africana]|nr:hypothetical protein [Spirochaeta africana]